MECMSNFKIAFFTKVEYKDNFRNKKSKQYMKSALLLGRKNTKQKKIKTLTTNKIISFRKPINSPMSETKNNLPKIN